MNNVVDRVPTEVLSNGAVRWEQFDSSGNSLGYVYLKRADEPTEAGTPLNKVLFDSIKTDIQSRLLTANKATQAQAEAGTDNTNYMTALRVAQAKLGSRINISTGTVNDGDTIPQTSGYEHYAYFVSPFMSSYVSRTDNNEIFGVEYRIDCSVNQSTRVVTSKAYLGVRNASTWSTTTTSIKANYIEIAWK